LYVRFDEDLEGDEESAGFFLAEFSTASRTFTVTDWRPIPREGFESRGAYHLVLADETRAEIIKWAWDSGASLIEAHTHGLGKPARFSPSDMSGLRGWVPHLWWRLRARPYAAIVRDAQTFDALAWIEDADEPEQVSRLVVDEAHVIRTTGRTLEWSIQ
jgi:hypothetical protein